MFNRPKGEDSKGGGAFGPLWLIVPAILICAIILLPIFPGIDQLFISRFQIPGVDIELNNAANRTESLSIAASRREPKSLGKFHFAKYAQFIDEDFLDVRESIYKRQFGGKSLPKIAALDSTAQILRKYVSPYVRCINYYLTFESDVVDAETQDVIRIGRNTALYINKMLKRNREKISSDSFESLSKTIYNDNIHIDFASNGAENKSNELGHSVENFLVAIIKDHLRIKGKIKTFKSVFDLQDEDIDDNCKVGPYSELDIPAFIDSFFVAYIPLMIADAQWFGFDSNRLTKFVNEIDAVNNLVKEEANYKNFIVTRKYISEGSEFLYKEILDNSRDLLNMADAYGIKNSMHSISLRNKIFSSECSKFAYFSKNENECIDLYALFLWMEGVNLYLSNINDAIIANYQGAKDHKNDYMTSEAKNLFVQFGQILYASAKHPDDLSRSIMQEARAEYASVLETNDRAKYSEFQETLLMFNVFRMVIEDKFTQDRLASINTLAATNASLEQVRDWCKGKSLADPNNQNNKILLRETEAQLAILSQIRVQLH
jgi:hypothetical protein